MDLVFAQCYVTHLIFNQQTDRLCLLIACAGVTDDVFLEGQTIRGTPNSNPLTAVILDQILDEMIAVPLAIPGNSFRKKIPLDKLPTIRLRRIRLSESL